MPPYRYLFGPLPSRRFGRSLGVDLLPVKTCPLNCIFCQLGPTENPARQRSERVPTAAVIDELAHWLRHDGQADVITLGGSGEPTLHTRFGEILAWIREHTPTPTLLLSNGALFADPAVRRAATAAATVKLGLHAWDAASFARVCRPHPALVFDAIIAGYQRFREAYAGTLVLEVFVVPGFNDTPAAMDRLSALAARIRPERIDLNTAVRPGADRSVRAADPECLLRLAGRFDPPARIPGRAPRGTADLPDDELVALLRRHPCSAAALADFCGLTPPAMQRRIEALARVVPLQHDPQTQCWHIATP